MTNLSNSRLWAAGIAATAALMAAAAPSQAAQRYQAFDLGSFFPLGINNNGVVIGNSNGELIAYDNFRSGDVTREEYGNHTQVGLRINNDNTIVGSSVNSNNSSYYGFTEQLNTGGNKFSTSDWHTCTADGFAFGINDLNESVGIADLTGYPYAFYEFGTGAKQVMYGPDNSALLLPFAVNNSGIATGTVIDPDSGSIWGFYYDTVNGYGDWLPGVEASGEYIEVANGLNNTGDFIGTAFDESGDIDGFLLSEENGYELLSGPNGPGIPIAVNDSHTVVGASLGTDDIEPYLWKGTKRYNLNNFVPYGSPFQLQIPTDINKFGQIIVAANVTGTPPTDLETALTTSGMATYLSGYASEAYLLVPQGDAPVVESVKFRGPYHANEPVKCIVVLDEPAPAGGETVQLSSDSAVTLPSSIFIPQGANDLEFTITSTGVNGTDTVLAQLNSAWQTGQFTVALH